MDILNAAVNNPEAYALQLSELIGPFLGMIAILIAAFIFKDFIMKFGKGIAFSMNSQFREGDHVLLDDEAALIVKIGMTQTVFGINKASGDYIILIDGDTILHPNFIQDHIESFEILKT